MRCDECKYWRGFDGDGQCQRFPPNPTFPYTGGHQWCGEFQRKSESAQYLRDELEFDAALKEQTEMDKRQ